jgi:hypothetical protein
MILPGRRVIRNTELIAISSVTGEEISKVIKTLVQLLTSRSFRSRFAGENRIEKSTWTASQRSA